MRWPGNHPIVHAPSLSAAALAGVRAAPPLILTLNSPYSNVRTENAGGWLQVVEASRDWPRVIILTVARAVSSHPAAQELGRVADTRACNSQVDNLVAM